MQFKRFFVPSTAVLSTAVLSTALLATSCAELEPLETSEQSKEIIGGAAAKVGDYPTTVAVFNGGLCTGTLIAPSWILTAAHCITPSLLRLGSQQEVTNRTTIILDTANLFDEGQGIQIQASETIPHTGFSINALGDNDIGLIKLKTPVTDRAPMIINRFRQDAPIGITVTQVGYGQTMGDNQNSAGRLFALTGKVSASCSTWNQPGNEISDTDLLCYSQTDGKGKCSGDSGGPSYATINGAERVVGVTSFGDQFCQQFGADTRVDAELDFLYQHIPEIQCQADGACNESCDKDGLPVDEDCDVCENDSDCEEMQVCSKDMRCVPGAYTPGGDGYECVADDECDSNICAEDTEQKICTSTCDQNSDCQDGFECLEASADGTSVCWPKDEGGCGCASNSGNSAPFALFILGLAFFFGRKPRRQKRG